MRLPPVERQMLMNQSAILATQLQLVPESCPAREELREMLREEYRKTGLMLREDARSGG